MKKIYGVVAVLTVGLMLTDHPIQADQAQPAAGGTPAVSKPAVVATPSTKVKKAKKTKKTAKESKETWVCPMGDYSGSKTADGKCPKCGMDLMKQAPATKSEEKKPESKPTVKADSKKTVWVCPMGDYTGDKPGKCPNCGMDLVEKK